MSIPTVGVRVKLPPNQIRVNREPCLFLFGEHFIIIEKMITSGRIIDILVLAVHLISWYQTEE